MGWEIRKLKAVSFSLLRVVLETDFVVADTQDEGRSGRYCKMGGS